ncbi:hypothetical protein BOX15_Mlig016793g1, partial [Macrostomum lignano]
RMPVADLNSWLAEYQRLINSDSPLDAIREFASRSRADLALFDALEQRLDACQDHRLAEPVCSRLFEFFKHPEPQLHRLTVEMLPCLIVAYLRAVHRRQWLALSDDEAAAADWVRWYDLMETLVLGLYNLSVAEPASASSADQLASVPGLGRSSIYHSAAARPGQRNWARLRQWPRRPASRIHHENRQAVLAQLMGVYTDRLLGLSERSLRSCLAAVGQLCDLGGQGRTRLVVDQTLLLQCVHAAYAVMHSRQGVPAPGTDGGTLDNLASRALLQLRARAEYELFSDVLLVVNAILSPHSRLGQEVGAFGVSLTPQQPLPDASSAPNGKRLVTNASFRIRHLPEDIDRRSSSATTARADVHNEVDGNDHDEDDEDAVLGNGSTAGALPKVTVELADVNGEASGDEWQLASEEAPL